MIVKELDPMVYNKWINMVKYDQISDDLYQTDFFS